MKATWNNLVVAEVPKEELIYIEGNWYFPPSSLATEYFTESPTPYTCPWKGACQYFNLEDGATREPDAAWSYPEPMPTAIDKVKKDFSNYVAFGRDVTVSE